MEKYSVTPGTLKNILFSVIVLGGLYLVSFYSYLLFHSLAELFSIFVALGIFIIAWNTRRITDNSFLLFIGIAYLFIAFIDLIHSLGYKGMGIFHGYDTNLSTQLWIAARYVESLSLLIAPLFIARKLKVGKALTFYAILVAVLMSTIFYWKVFPDCFIEGKGLTLFKKISEYVISSILLASIFFLYNKRRELDKNVFYMLVASIVLTIASEMSFTFYIHPYGLSNLIGHFFKIISFYLIYKALIVTGLAKPFNLIFRELKNNEEMLRLSKEHYRSVVDDQTELICRWKPDGILTFVNDAYCRYFNKKREDLIGHSFMPLIPDVDHENVKKHFMSLNKETPVGTHEHRVISPHGLIRWQQWTNRAIFNNDRGQLINEYQSVGRDITDLKKAEETLQLSNRLLEISNKHIGLSPLLEEYVKEVKNFTRCSAVGIRILDAEGNIPYQAYNGFSKKFYETESPLSIKSDACMCINVINEKTDSDLPYFTKNGSFYTNSSTKLLATVPEDQKGKTRNVCNREGYESVVLIPIFSGSTMLGLIHVADTKENSIPLETVHILEKVAMQLGAAINRVRMGSDLQNALEYSRRREAEVSALLKGSRAVLESHEFKNTARLIFDSCKDLVEATAGYVAILTEDRTENDVLFLDAGGLPCTVDPNLPMPIRGLRREAYRTGKTVLDNDFAKSKWVKYLPEGHAPLKNILFTPLVIEGETVGLMGLANKPSGFTENDARIAMAFGELAAIALKNSRTLELLEDSEERFRSVVETANDGIISADSSGNIISWNNGAEAIFGYSAHEIIGKPVTLIMPERLHKSHKNGMSKAVASHYPIYNDKTFEFSGLRKDGNEFSLELSIAKWETKEGVFFTAIIREITERKEIEKELQRHRKRLMELVAERTAELQKTNEELEQEITERILAEKQAKLMALFAELNPSPVLRFDINGKVLMANPSAEDILSKKSLKGSALTSIIPGIEKFDLAGCIHNGEIRSHTTEIGDKFFHFIFKGLPHLEMGQIYGSDITEQKKAEGEALRASHLASLGELAAGVAHEINNPVNGIINYTQILLNKYKPGTKEHDIARRIIKEGDRIDAIVKNLLSFARERKEKKHPVSIYEIMSSSLALTETQLKKDGIELNVNIPFDLAQISAVPLQIEQVFLNIISNSRYALNRKNQAAHKDKIIEIIGERVTIEERPHVRITIYDNGIGIPFEILDKIMNPFFTTKPSDIGTGLGLSISHGIIHDHGGKIRVESSEGNFTKVIIDIPQINQTSSDKQERQLILHKEQTSKKPQDNKGKV